MAVAMVSGTAVITPVADLAGTSIAANAADATVVTTEDELRTALAAGGQVKLGDDFTCSNINTPPCAKNDAVLDLNGHTLTLTWTNMIVDKEKTLTITDNSDTGTGTICQTENTAVMLTRANSTLNILKGNFNGRYLKYFFEIGSSSTSTNDTLHITGGTFDKDISAYLSDDYTLKQADDNKYQVVPSTAEVSNYDELVQAVEAGGKIKLTSDIDTNGGDITIDKACIIDFNGKKITITKNSQGGVIINAPATLKNGELYHGGNSKLNNVHINADTTLDGMTISAYENAGGGVLKQDTKETPDIVIKDTTINVIDKGQTTGRGLTLYNGGPASVSFYGDVVINEQDANIIYASDVYVYGNVYSNHKIAFKEDKSSKVHFLGGSVKCAKDTTVFYNNYFNPSNVVTADEKGNNYKLFSDKDCTAPLSAEDICSAQAVYSKSPTIAQGEYWKVVDDDLDGENYKLTVFGTVPDTTGEIFQAPWSSYQDKITEVNAEENTKLSADAHGLFSYLSNAVSMDLSNLDTSDVTDMSYMFCCCPKLETIYVGCGWTAANVTASDSMFSSCSNSLVGGAGTQWNDSNPTDSTYAKVDGGTASPGYFTLKPVPFNFTAVADKVTVKDKNGNTVALTDNTADIGIGCTIVSTVPLAFDGAKTTFSNGDEDYEYDGTDYFYTVDEISKDTVAVTQSEWIFVSTSRELNCVFLRTKGALKAKLLNDISFSDDEYITDIRPIVFTLDFNNHSINSSNYTLHCYPYGTDGDIGGNVSLLNGTVNTSQFQTNARYNSIFNLENMTFNGYVSFACKTTNIKNVKVQKPKDYDVNIYFWSDCKEVNIENLEMSGTSVSFGSYSQPMNVTISGNVLTDSYVDLSGNTSFVFKNGASWVSTYDGSKEWSPYCFNLKNQSEERCATLSGYKDNTTECGLFTDEDMTVPFEMDTLDEISAVYARPLKNYTVTWKNDDGTLIDTTQAKEGTAPAYDGNEPAKDGYVFAGWKDDNDTFYAKGTELPNVTANAVYTAAFGKEIAVGTEFYIGDIFNTNGSKYIAYTNRYNSGSSYDCCTVVPTPEYISYDNYWYFDNLLGDDESLYFYYDFYNGTVSVRGFKCTGGDGTEDNPYTFELMYDDLESSEIDFSAVAESVSIKDADGKNIALTNGKATVQKDYVITSDKPLAFPDTVYAKQQDGGEKFVYTIVSMISDSAAVSYDTTAFKGTVYAYTGFDVSGYEGTSAKKKSQSLYNKSAWFDFSRGTTIVATTFYTYEPVDELFDIYDADGTKINNLFNLVVGKNNYGENLYTYSPKQNIETDISVFKAGTKFSVTLPEGVEIENKDVILSQADNVYTTKPAADITLLSDTPINVYETDGNIYLVDTKYKAVKNGRFVYEMRVTSELTAVTSSAKVIRTQEDFANVKPGDYLMPSETLTISGQEYGWFERENYLQTINGYYGMGSGSSMDEGEAVTIGTDLILYSNGESLCVPANPDLCTNHSGEYDIETCQGNAWRVSALSGECGSKSITLVGADYTEKADYEFTWADNCQSATVVFNSEEPVNAVVTIKTDSDGNTIYTAAAVYNGITYIETKTVNVGEQDGFEYVIVEGENKITITKYNGSAEEVTIPEEINGIPVTAIGNEAFKNNAILKDVIIPLNIEKIGKDAFAGCSEELNIHGYRRTDSERYATENEINFIAIPYPLENASTISSDHADINEQIKVTGAGVEGTLSYKYAVYYKPADSETWTTRQGYSENNVITLTFTKGGTYDICVKVKDTAGSVEKKYFKVAVTRPLANTSKISANAITLGDSFVVDMSAKDGSGTYEYAVETKHISEKEWTTVSDYSDKESVTVTPDKAGAQNIRVSVKDSFGNINKKSFIVDVQNVKPNNNSTISATDIKVGESLTVNCNAELGAGSFRYAVYQKALEAEKWTTVQNFAENPEVKTTFKKPGLYQICAKAIDADKTITKKYFTVNVTKDTLINNSAISADSVTAGESIDITAAAEGGFGTFTYAVYYKLSESSKWTVVQKFTDNDKVTITPAKAGRYDICVKVSDETGEIVKKYFMAEVKHQQLVNKCTISADTIRQGESIIVTANAENGSGSYQYAVYLKSTEKTAWNTVQDFSEQSEITVKPKNKGDYDICMKVMDSDGTIAKIYTSVYVK